MLLNDYARPSIRELPMIAQPPRAALMPYRATPEEAAVFMRRWIEEAAWADRWSGWGWYRDICLANATGWASR